MSSIQNKADQAKKGLNDPFAKRDQNKPSLGANPVSNQKANLNTKQKINMLNSRQKLAEQLLSGEAEPEGAKPSEQTAEKKAPPKFKRPGMKSENDANAEKKPKVNLDDLLDNYEKHELPEADINKISNQDKAETQKESLKAAENINNEREKQGVDIGEKEQGMEKKYLGKEVETVQNKSNEVKKLENYNNPQLNTQSDLDSNENIKANIQSEQQKANLASENQERIDMVLNNEDAEDHNTTSNMNLNPSENTFDDINLNSNNENTNTSKFKGIGSTTSINPKTAIFEEDIGSSNNLFESTTSHTKNFFENLSTANNIDNQIDYNNIQTNNNNYNVNNNNNSLNYSSAVINLGSEKTIGLNHSNNNLAVVSNTNNNSEKDLLGVSPKQADNIDFHINPNHHENKSSNTNSENNHTSQGEDNLSIPEINCKSIELTNENFANEKKHSANSSNMNLNNQSNGNYQDIKEFSSEANNFFSNFKEENAAADKYNNNNINNNNNNKAMTVTNFDENAKHKKANRSNKNLKDYTENFNDKETIGSNASEDKEENNHPLSNFNRGKKNEECIVESHGISNENHNQFGSGEKQRIQILEKEINNLRKIIGEYKRKEIEENESMLKLEIVNLRNTVNSKTSENQLLQNENKNLKTHIKMLQENIETYFSSENKINIINTVETEIPKRIETELKQEEKAIEKSSKENKIMQNEHKTDSTEKSSTIFDSDATRNTKVFSDSNISSTIFKSNTPQNTSLESSTSNKNKMAENTQKKKAGPVVSNPPPLFKMQNKNALNYNNPSALFESSSNQSTGKSTELFD